MSKKTVDIQNPRFMSVTVTYAVAQIQGDSRTGEFEVCFKLSHGHALLAVASDMVRMAKDALDEFMRDPEFKGFDRSKLQIETPRTHGHRGKYIWVCCKAKCPVHVH